MNLDNLSEDTVYAALIPCYESGNNVVKTVKPNGEMGIINKGIKLVIRSMMQKSRIDIANIRKDYKNYGNRRNLIPIPLSVETILVPVRVRKAVAGNDGSHAYVNLIYLDDIGGEENAVIKLSCGYEINALESRYTVRNRFRIGYIIRDRYCCSLLNRSSMKDALMSINDEYSKPAEKGDIALIIRELMIIRNKIS